MYEGETCDKDIADQCNACHEPGTLSCIEYLGGFYCECKLKWWGNVCAFYSDTKPSEQKGNYYKLSETPVQKFVWFFLFFGARRRMFKFKKFK